MGLRLGGVACYSAAGVLQIVSGFCRWQLQRHRRDPLRQPGVQAALTFGGISAFSAAPVLFVLLFLDSSGLLGTLDAFGTGLRWRESCTPSAAPCEQDGSDVLI